MTPSLIPVPRSLRLRLWYGLVAAGIFNMVAIVEGILTPGYDANQQAISALSLGRWGWTQITSFILLGIVIISTAFAWRKILAGGSGARSYPLLTIFTGISVILCGLFRQDPAPGYDPENLALTAPSLTGLLHLLFAAIGALSSITGLIVMAIRFAKTPLWKNWAIYSTLMALIMIGCITVYGIWSTEPKGYAGLFERIGLLVVPIWALSFLIRLVHGVPFMRSGTSHNRN
jgi:hypothetical protein